MKASEMIVGEEYAIRYTRTCAQYAIYLGPISRCGVRQALVAFNADGHFKPPACNDPKAKWDIRCVSYGTVLRLAAEHRAREEESRRVTEQCAAEKRARCPSRTRSIG